MENEQVCTWGETIQKHGSHKIGRKTYKTRKDT